uniref:C2H2-type domain-containing protein n=1 Tax=Anolis carolinensis TaxID=28377 RepID=A0A803T2G3_ANOCA|nr:PREDICTED: zinc finger protein 660 [Anolis carolinensis]|eukprot:XP_008104165.1 PREDICTED: zinc finger protein 660 [Anolis carolinensis]
MRIMDRLLNSSSKKSAIKEEPEGVDVTPTGSSDGGPCVIAGEKTPVEDTLGPDVQPGQGKVNPAGEANEVVSDTKEGPPLRWVVKEEGNGSATVLSENEWSLLPLPLSSSGKDGRESENEEKTTDAEVENAQPRHEEGNTGERKGEGEGMRQEAEKNVLCPPILSQLDEDKAQGCAECVKTYCTNPHGSQIISTIEKLFQCSGCGKQFSSYGCVVSHQKNHKGEKPYKCRECDQSFRLKSELLSHQGMHPGDKPYKCCECGKGFDGSLELIRHEIHHGGEKFYKCLECGKHFRSAVLLDAHGKTHIEKQSGIGLECAKSFQTSTPLISHELTKVEKLHKCMQCGESFSGRECLNMHTRTHTGEKPYTCLDCGKAFTASASFKEHRRTHTRKKSHKCLECGKSFTGRGNLDAHTRIHTGEKPFKCVECGKSFRQKGKFNVHKRTHTGEKPHKCLECGKSFHAKEYLTRHNRTHTENPHKCLECGNSFCQLADLSSHQSIHMRKQTNILSSFQAPYVMCLPGSISSFGIRKDTLYTQFQIQPSNPGYTYSLGNVSIVP